MSALTFHMKRKTLVLLTFVVFLTGLCAQTAASQTMVTVTIRIESRPVDDVYLRTHGLTIDAPLHGDYWNYPAEVIAVTSAEPFTYERVVELPCCSHYVEYAVSGWGITPVSDPNFPVKTYPWEAWIFVDGVEIAYGDKVGRDNPLRGEFKIPCPGIPLFSDILLILPLGIVAGALIVKRRKT